MARPTRFTEADKNLGIQMRMKGVQWQHIADELGFSKDAVMYHCSPKRKAQVQKAISKYHKNNYEKVRDKQREYVASAKVQPSKPEKAVEDSGVSPTALG